ncbi:NAD-dependent epimerase/dehydratase family protein [Chitinilyticum litopenaei]|uniref:NAD-dependent epimerase/dehydratase family protein n=1 Tax=Chitinilyticum litopenaei TaxID=1121276 RepID=UPI001FE1066E|nr:NAD-dependent epimerase/dehydratase family protein [Chitinilyticum litopenaei]
MQRALPWLTRRFHVYALVRNPAQADRLRALGVRPVAGDLDKPDSLSRLAGIAELLLHSAPPPPGGTTDPRTRRLCAALSRPRHKNMVTQPPQAAVYISTSGVYGDCAGAWVSEHRPTRPESPRAQRRVSAERQLRDWAQRCGCRLAILRAPGIYAADRLPIDRLRQGTPVPLASEDGFSNHIHADDLAMASCLALLRGRPLRIYHASDDQPQATGDWLSAVARACGLPVPPRLARAELQQAVGPSLWSFLRESRRLDNRRLREELRLRLRYPETDSLLNMLSTE